MNGISFIVINFKNYQLTYDCINSILANKTYNKLKDEIILIDNASADGSLEKLELEFGSQIAVVANDKNLGFGMANNKAASKAENDSLIFINNDTVSSNTDFQKLKIAFHRASNVGFLGIKILNRDLSIQSVGYPDPSVCVDFNLHILFSESRIRKSYRFRNYANRGLFETGWISGCFMMVAKNVFFDLDGGFDEKIFMYAEDIDICYRAQKIGLVNYCFDETSVVHFSGSSTDAQGYNSLKGMIKPLRNYFYVLKKNGIVGGFSRSAIVVFTYIHTFLLWFARFLLSYLRRSKRPNAIG